MSENEMLQLKGTHLAPYIQLAVALIGKAREGGGNMFRHQIDTMAKLIDYGYTDPVLLKASIVHDVIEDVPNFSHNTLMNVDSDGPAVYDLVMQVTRQPDETKPEYLTRVRVHGSHQAKILKAADRISNMISLGFVNKIEFVKRYTEETVIYLYPIAEEVDERMLTELKDLVESRRKYVSLLTRFE
jgi:(p)ppGpp synthase/HD superfamily hydrolase